VLSEWRAIDGGNPELTALEAAVAERLPASQELEMAPREPVVRVDVAESPNGGIVRPVGTMSASGTRSAT
jgi:hypothetical protein